MHIGLVEGLVIGTMIYFIHTYTEVPMDKSDKNAPNTAVGAAMEKAAEAQEAEVIELTDEEQPVEQAEIAEYIIDMPSNEVPVMYQDVAIYGSHLVSTKFLNIVKHALECDDFLKEDIVKIIIFSPEQPVDQHGNPYFACYKPEAKLIGLNLQQHFNGAVDLIKEVDGYMSLRGHIWYNMILSIYHELYHGLFIATDAEKEMTDMSEIEATCNDMADEALTALYREYDAEPPAMADEPFFGLRYMEFYIREIQNGEESWCVRQDALHDGMNIHYDDERKEYIKLFRSFIRYTHGGDADHKDPTWDMEPTRTQRGTWSRNRWCSYQRLPHLKLSLMCNRRLSLLHSKHQLVCSMVLILMEQSRTMKTRSAWMTVLILWKTMTRFHRRLLTSTWQVR